MSYFSTARFMKLTGIAFAIIAPVVGLLLSPPDEYLMRLFLLLPPLGLTLYANGRYMHTFQSKGHIERKREGVNAVSKILMFLSPFISTSAVLAWGLWRSGYCLCLTISGLCMTVFAATLSRFASKGRKAQTKRV